MSIIYKLPKNKIDICSKLESKHLALAVLKLATKLGFCYFFKGNEATKIFKKIDKDGNGYITAMELVDEFEARYPEECSEYEAAAKDILRITEEFAGFEINGVGMDDPHAQGYMDAIWVTLLPAKIVHLTDVS